MVDTLSREYTLPGLTEGQCSITVITGSGIDVEAGLPSFRGEKDIMKTVKLLTLLQLKRFTLNLCGNGDGT